MQSHKFEVVVACIKNVLDPDGRVICEAFRQKDYSLKAVDVSKRYILTLEGDLVSCERQAKKLAREHLANPTAEDFFIRRLDK